MADSIIISEILSGKDLKAFIKFPNILYKNSKSYVPALSAREKKLLSRKKNPAFEYCKARFWLARKNGKVTGRIAGIWNPLHFEAWNRKLLRFGWFDFIDDKKVSGLLLKEVEKWASELECEGVHGPLGFTDLDRKGTLIEGFDEAGSYPTLYNFPYYMEHLKNHGYGKEIDWVEYEITVPGEVPEKVRRVNQLVLKRSGLQFMEHVH